MSKIILSAFADEYSQDFDKQVEVLVNNDIHYIEPRNIFGKGLFEFSLEEIKSFKDKLDKNNIKVYSIGSPLGKIDITDDMEEHLKKARKIFEIAKILGAKCIRMFSFYNRTNLPFEEFEKESFARVEKLINLADEYNLVLCHENEALIYGESYDSCKKLLDHFNGKLKAVFDMGNFNLDGYDALKAYEVLKDYIEYFHLKDSLKEGAIVPAGKGQAYIKEILSKYLKDFNKDTIATIEPHLESFDGLNALVGKAFVNPYKFKDCEEAFLEGVKASQEIINNLN